MYPIHLLPVAMASPNRDILHAYRAYLDSFGLATFYCLFTITISFYQGFHKDIAPSQCQPILETRNYSGLLNLVYRHITYQHFKRQVILSRSKKVIKENNIACSLH